MGGRERRRCPAFQGQEALRAANWRAPFSGDECPGVLGVTPDFSSLIQAIIRLFPSIDPPSPAADTAPLGTGDGGGGGQSWEMGCAVAQAKLGQGRERRSHMCTLPAACPMHANHSACTWTGARTAHVHVDRSVHGASERGRVRAMPKCPDGARCGSRSPPVLATATPPRGRCRCDWADKSTNEQIVVRCCHCPGS